MRGIAQQVGRAILGLVLVVLYYAVFTPVGLILRLLGRDELELRRRPGVTTYWKRKPDSDGLRRST